MPMAVDAHADSNRVAMYTSAKKDRLLSDDEIG
jgi:hypothetical protein